MDLMLENKVAVVTGASKGIGLAVTKSLVQEGAHVVAGALTTDSLSGIRGVTAVALDLTDPAAPGELVQAGQSTTTDGSMCSSTTWGPLGSGSMASWLSTTNSSNGQCR